MGSGSGGAYSYGGSQPYAPCYHVTSEMKQYDINNGTFHDGKYDKNPTARRLVDTINGNYIVDKSYNGDNFTYVIDMDGNIIFGKRNGNGPKPAQATPHPTLIGGKNPEVQMAGILKIRNGKIFSQNLSFSPKIARSMSDSE